MYYPCNMKIHAIQQCMILFKRTRQFTIHIQQIPFECLLTKQVFEKTQCFDCVFGINYVLLLVSVRPRELQDDETQELR